MGFYSRWGSIISLSALDWGCIRNLNGWGCNQEWGSNRADTVYDFEGIYIYSESKSDADALRSIFSQNITKSTVLTS